MLAICVYLNILQYEIAIMKTVFINTKRWESWSELKKTLY